MPADETLAQLRTRIDLVDAELVRLLAQRFEITDLIGEHKATAGLPPADPDREAALMSRIRSIATDAGVDHHFCERLFRLIVDEVVRRHVKAADVA